MARLPPVLRACLWEQCDSEWEGETGDGRGINKPAQQPRKWTRDTAREPQHERGSRRRTQHRGRGNRVCLLSA